MMKRIIIFLFLTFAVCIGAFGQLDLNYYVSANGNDDNDGKSELTAFKTINKAFSKLSLNGATVKSLTRETVKLKITVIGTLNNNGSGIFVPGSDYVFDFYYPSEYGKASGPIEFIITGKPDATGVQRAVLSAHGSDALAVLVRGEFTAIRFEHIEISGGNGKMGSGIYISDHAVVTLGTGTVVRNSTGNGIYINDGFCILDNGEVQDNNSNGVWVSQKGNFIMKNGTIRRNKTSIFGGGVVVLDGGSFSMTGGTISGNQAAQRGGGVAVAPGGKFEHKGGTVNGNTAPQFPDIWRDN
jgi:hypothetical protein